MLIVVPCFGMCSWVDVELPEEPQYQYSEQQSSDQQQEQYEEGKYNMNNLSL